MDGKLTYEQMEAAFYLVAADLCFIWLARDGGPFLSNENTGVRNLGHCLYEVGPNLNDTFYWASADCETIPWDEVVGVADACKSFPNEDSHLYLIHWAAGKRGHDPQIPQVKAKLDDFRARYPALCAEGHAK